MRCFYVLVHGKLDWSLAQPEARGADRPAGFYCHRYVLAESEADAAERAFRRVRENLRRGTDWLSDGSVGLTLEVEEATVAPMHKLLKPENRGHAFYAEE